MWEGMRGIKGGEQNIRVHLKLVRLPACRMIDERKEFDYDRLDGEVLLLLICGCFGNLLANS